MNGVASYTTPLRLADFPAILSIIIPARMARKMENSNDQGAYMRLTCDQALFSFRLVKSIFASDPVRVVR